MRVAHIIKVTRISGAERHLLLLLAGLRQRGIDAQLIMLVERSQPMEEMLQEAQEREVPIRRLRIHRDYDLSLVWRIRRLLREIQPDIVHTHLVHADLFGYLAAKAAGVQRVISSRHNDDAFRYRGNWRWIHRRLWRMIDAGIAISAAIKAFASEIEGAPPEKITVVHYGIPHNWLSDEVIEASRHRFRRELGLAEDAQLLGMVCRLVEQKGIPYAMEALRRIQADQPEAHLVIVGDGEKAAELKRLAGMLNIGERVHWLGWRSDAAELMTAFDLLLLPSLWEGFGLVLLEAMSRRLPVIASRVSAIPEVVSHGETGILVPARDVDALAEAINNLLDDRALRKHMGLLGAARVEEHFSLERMVDGTIAVYQKVQRN